MGRLSGHNGMLRHFTAAVAGSVRHKLLALVLAPLLLGVPVLLLIVWVWGTEGYNRLMINKVSADLGAAQEFFDRQETRISVHLDGVAGSYRLITALNQNDQDGLSALLQSQATRLGLDYLLLLDADGHVRAGTEGDDNRDRSYWPVVRAAMGGQGLHGLEVFPPEELGRSALT